MVKILTEDRYQKGEDVIACNYTSARKAIKEIHKKLFL